MVDDLRHVSFNWTFDCLKKPPNFILISTCLIHHQFRKRSGPVIRVPSLTFWPFYAINPTVSSGSQESHRAIAWYLRPSSVEKDVPPDLPRSSLEVWMPSLKRFFEKKKKKTHVPFFWEGWIGVQYANIPIYIYIYTVYIYIDRTATSAKPGTLKKSILTKITHPRKKNKKHATPPQREHGGFAHDS